MATIQDKPKTDFTMTMNSTFSKTTYNRPIHERVDDEIFERSKRLEKKRFVIGLQRASADPDAFNPSFRPNTTLS
jgi:hypothetical protein